MNRREFFARSNPLRADSGARATAHELTAFDRNELFMRAMAQGIDPATVDHERLPELLGVKAVAVKT
jgi:hypothetical protein